MEARRERGGVVNSERSRRGAKTCKCLACRYFRGDGHCCETFLVASRFRHAGEPGAFAETFDRLKMRSQSSFVSPTAAMHYFLWYIFLTAVPARETTGSSPSGGLPPVVERQATLPRSVLTRCIPNGCGCDCSPPSQCTQWQFFCGARKIPYFFETRRTGTILRRFQFFFTLRKL